MPTPSELDPAILHREIAQLETDAARLEIERKARAKSVAQLTRRQRYLRLARWFRRPTETFPAYPVAVFAIGPLAVGVLAFVLVSLVLSSWTLAFAGLLVAAVAGAVGFASLLYRPAGSVLSQEISAADAKLGVATSQLQETTAAAAEMDRRLAVLYEQRSELVKSDKLQRAMLLQRNWKSLRGAEWEDYVVEVCRTLGANVQRGAPSEATPIAGGPAKGPRGVLRRMPTTLFVTFSPRRLAVAAVSEIVPFHAAAVRQIIDELAHKGCDELGIITNARLTAGSKEFARSRHCTLIGEDEFPDFVLGKIAL